MPSARGLLLISSLALSACAQLPETQREIIDQLVIQNRSNDSLTNVVLRVPAQKTVVKTNTILPRRNYTIGFAASRNPRHSATLSWERNGKAISRPVITHVPETKDNVNPHRVVIQVHSNDQLKSTIQRHDSQ